MFANLRGKLRKNLSPRILRTPFDKAIPPDGEHDFLGAGGEMGAQFIVMQFDVLRKALTQQQPDVIGRQGERFVMSKGPVNCTNHWVNFR